MVIARLRLSRKKKRRKRERDINRFKKGGRLNEHFMRCLVVKYYTIVYIFTAQRTLGSVVVDVAGSSRRSQSTETMAHGLVVCV